MVGHLKDIKKRIIESDLVPSRMKLLDDIDQNFNILENCGYDTPKKLRNGLKSKKQLSLLYKDTGISEDYLKLLKREIESYFPKKIKIMEFIYADKTIIDQCLKKGIIDSLVFYELYKDKTIEDSALKTLFDQVRLTRIQWVSPMAAEMFISAGYTTPELIKNADAEKFCSDVRVINKEKKFFKGNIGLRDIKRVIKSTEYVE